MAGLRKEAPPEETNGAPMWMVTFSDCMNLLLTFFVLLVTFSSFGDDSRDRILNFGAAMRAVFGSPSKVSGNQDQSSMLPIHQPVATEQPQHGSDKPTDSTPPIPREGVLNETLEAADYHRHKVFLIPSRKVFLGRGTALSAEGRYLLGVMAAFLNEVQGPVVLSENGPDPQPAGMHLGLSRALAVLDYFGSLQNVDRRRFSIAAESTAPPEDAAGEVRAYHRQERMLEIALLEGSVQR
jgi:hypothetical protein